MPNSFDGFCSLWPGRILRGRMRDMHASVLRITLSCGIETPIIKMYSALQFLKIDDMYKLELYNFMHQLHHSKLPDVFYKLFTIITSAHAHNIRFKQSAFHVSSPVNKSFCKKKQFSYRGNNLWCKVDSNYKSIQYTGLLVKKISK